MIANFKLWNLSRLWGGQGGDTWFCTMRCTVQRLIYIYHQRFLYFCTLQGGVGYPFLPKLKYFIGQFVCNVTWSRDMISLWTKNCFSPNMVISYIVGKLFWCWFRITLEIASKNEVLERYSFPLVTWPISKLNISGGWTSFLDADCNVIHSESASK